MALIICTECGKEFSDKAPACPNCGCPTDCIVESAEEGNGQENTIDSDIEKYIEVYGKDRIAICKEVAHAHNLSLSAAKKEVDNYFRANAEQIKGKEEYRNLEEKEKVLQYDKEGIPYCPKCHSISITYTDKKLSLGRAIVGNALAGGVGAVLGGQSSKKGKCKCLKCGHTWKI